MCYGCWQDYGQPTVWNAKVRAIQPLIAAVHRYNFGGGNLHIVVDDFNMEDGNLEFCQRELDKGGDGDSPEQLAAEQACLTAFKSMALEERAAALGLYDGYWRVIP